MGQSLRKDTSRSEASGQTSAQLTPKEQEDARYWDKRNIGAMEMLGKRYRYREIELSDYERKRNDEGFDFFSNWFSGLEVKNFIAEHPEIRVAKRLTLHQHQSRQGSNGFCVHIGIGTGL